MSNFEDQTKLLIQVLATVVRNSSYALKGGTAINFFYSNMPRLSVDIDLAYTKINSREEFLNENIDFCNQTAQLLTKKHGLIVKTLTTSDNVPKQLLISSRNTQIKTDINLVLRGTVYPTVIKTSCDLIRQKYGIRHQINILSFEDIYAGKFCAALDRQHPRDLFDVLMFFKENLITEKLKKAFLVYLLSGNRPISEMLNPNRLNQLQAFKNEFEGMTDISITYQDLEAARERLIHEVHKTLTEEDKDFLISFKIGSPKWELLGIDHVQTMPAIKWKLFNINKIDKLKHAEALKELRRKLDKLT